MKKFEALKRIESIHGKGCEYFIVDKLYDEEEDVPQEILDNLFRIRVPQTNVILCGVQTLKLFENFCKG